ncbi:hypothetical protein NDU88_001134 [Pleurodeles waltl]|uniref:Uncharacterized protein n=1 Tax=Pleurodeles waltl TaxID=8319 RepID=A0AAV7SAS4_PLEWA|nr:hypothetical protein NDU88_001134 [Pleurodeles waltl]
MGGCPCTPVLAFPCGGFCDGDLVGEGCVFFDLSNVDVFCKCVCVDSWIVIVWAYFCWRDGGGLVIASFSLAFGVADFCGCLHFGGLPVVGQNDRGGLPRRENHKKLTEQVSTNEAALSAMLPSVTKVRAHPTTLQEETGLVRWRVDDAMDQARQNNIRVVGMPEKIEGPCTDYIWNIG